MNIAQDDEYAYVQLLRTLQCHNGEISGSPDYTYDGFNNPITRKLGFINKTTTYDYVLMRENDMIIRDIRRTVQVITYNGEYLSDHYAMEAEILLPFGS